MAEDKKIAAALAKYEKSDLAAGAMDPMDFMVYYLFMAECECTSGEAAAAVQRLQKNFIDYNDIRVARWTEVADVLKPLPHADPAARRLREYLNRVFDTCGAMNLRFFADLKVTEAKKTLAALEPKLPKETGLLVLFAYLPGFAITISDEALALARQQGVIAKSGTRQNLQKALADSGVSMEKCAALVMYWELDAQKSAKKAAKAPAKAEKSVKTPEKKSKK